MIQTKKNKNDKTGDVTFEVKQKKARSQDFADWSFRVLPVDSWGRPEQITTEQIQRVGEKNEGDDPEKIRQWIEQASERYQWPMSRGDIKKSVFGDIGGQLNHGKQDTDLSIAINLGYLEQSTLKKNGAYMLQPPEKLPF